MADHRVNRVGEQIGPYHLTRLLGAGGFGEVYAAEHRLLQQSRAIKLLLERHFHDPKARERFLREARTLATLNHPNILPVLEVDEAGEVLYLVMPLYQRGTLSDLLKQHTTPLPLAEIKEYLAQICAALGHAHQQGIAHLDLKPENLLLHEDGRLVLADFGLAHLLKQGRLEAGTSASWGTPYYMAPEQIRGEPEPRSDLYALGVMLYQMLTMQRPFTGSTPEAVMMKQVLEVPPALHAAYPAAPAALEPVVQKALAKQPVDRYQTAEALLVDYRAAAGGAASASAQPPAPVSAPPAPPSPTPDPAPATQPIALASLNRPQAAAAGCEIPLPDGRLCGIPPVGRCSTCGRAFCTSHQGRDFQKNIVYVDMCAPCFAQTPAEVERVRRAKNVQEAYAAEQYCVHGSAQKALLAAGVQPVQLYQVVHQRITKKTWFSRPGYFDYKEVEEVTPFRRGWILGEISWGLRYGENKHLTALLDLMDESYLTSPLAEVEPYSGQNARYAGEYVFVRDTAHGGGGSPPTTSRSMGMQHGWRYCRRSSV